MRGDWPLAITAFNHGRNGISRALDAVGGKTLMDLINRFDGKRFGFASKNYYAEFLAAVDVERESRQPASAERQDRKSAGTGKSVSLGVGLGGRRVITKQNKRQDK